MSRRSVLFAAALAATLFGAARAHAEDTGAKGADYNAPDPNRDALNYARAFANLTFASFIIHQIDWFRGVDWIYVTRDSIGKTLNSPLGFDYDPLSENMLGHPLHGSLYFDSARAAGLSFWESCFFPIVGSLEWEAFGERQVVLGGGTWKSKPSISDLVSTSTAGILLGEVLHRLSSELLDDSTSGFERTMRELGATFVNPERGLNRLYTGDIWKSGDAPARPRPVHAELELGVDRLRTVHFRGVDTYDPAALFAIDIEYGDLLPNRKDQTLPPLEFFDAYVALNLADSSLAGAQVYGQGLLYGWSTNISRDQGERADNNVIGLIGDFDYQGANILQFAGLSVGPGDYVEWRWGHQRRLRLGMDVGWSYLTSQNSPFADAAHENHNYAVGGEVELSSMLEVQPYGQLAFRGQQFLTGVVDGQGEEEAISYARLSYELNLFPHVGVGAAPIILHRRSIDRDKEITSTALETQVYLRIHN